LPVGKVELSRYADKTTDQASPPMDQAKAFPGTTVKAEIKKKVGPDSGGAKEADKVMLRASGKEKKEASGLGHGEAALKLDNVKKDFEGTTGGATQKKKKPVMSKINSLRTDLCWKRKNLWEHEKCLKFLGLQCSKGSTGKGICEKFTKQADEHCADPTEKLKKVCKFFVKLTLIDEKPEKEEMKTPEKKAEEKPINDMDKDGIPDDEDLDRDGDGHKNKEDAFPDDPKEWNDLDKDGKGDNADEDRDGDGRKNDKDAFPDDPNEWRDIDKDGKGDSVDEDRDGDGMPNKDDAFPDDPYEWSDLDGDGIGDNADEDRDGDSVPNREDVFPDDPSEWSDFDKDGVGDNHDTDRDGDGFTNEEDSHPDDPTRPQDLDRDGVSDHEDWDIDGDGVPNEQDVDPRDRTKGWRDTDGDGHFDAQDAFPCDPLEWKDSDKDGVGDNSDECPDNPKFWKAPCKEDVAYSMDKVERGLPPDGYDEYSRGRVEHDDMKTHTHDWQKEWPQSDETETETMKRICAKEPHNKWCRRFNYS